MLTNVIDMTTAPSDLARQREAAGQSTQKVLIVNGGDEVLDLLETVLDAGHYDVVFVESAGHAYSQVKKVLPHLIIVCLNMEEDEGFGVLSMLKLDPETRLIPLLTCAGMPSEDGDDEPEELTEDQVFAPRPVVRMN